LALLVAMAFGTPLVLAAEPSVWDRAFDPTTGVRFIPDRHGAIPYVITSEGLS
jgi:hypothetical protein